MVPITNDVTKVPRAGCPDGSRFQNREKSMFTTSNIASPRNTNSTAMAALNHGDELTVPNVLAVSVTMTPSTP